MAQLFNGSICLSDIPKDKIVESTKNGKKYLNVTIWLNDAVDKYDNIGSIQVSQTKEQREAGEKSVYIGNYKATKAAAPKFGAPDEGKIGDLPF